MKYRSKPEIVEAEQWWPGKEVPGVRVGEKADQYRFCTTIDGFSAWVYPGDWVIAEPDGVHYRILTPEEFAARYEPTASCSVEAALAKCSGWQLTESELAALLS